MTTLSDWEQRNLDAGRLVGKLAPAPRSPVQAGLTATLPRYIVLPGVKGHKSYVIWDRQLNVPASEGDNRQAAMLAAWTLNTQTGT